MLPLFASVVGALLLVVLVYALFSGVLKAFL